MFSKNQCKQIVDLIYSTMGITQNKERHPEVDVYTHLIQGYELAKQSFNKLINELTLNTELTSQEKEHKVKQEKEFLLSVILHDIGKTSSDYQKHDMAGYYKLKELGFIPRNVLLLVRHHINIELYINDSNHNQWLSNIPKVIVEQLKRLHVIDAISRNPDLTPRFNVDEFYTIFSD